MAGARFLKCPGAREQGVGHPVPGTDLDTVCHPAPTLPAKALGLVDRGPYTRTVRGASGHSAADGLSHGRRHGEDGSYQQGAGCGKKFHGVTTNDLAKIAYFINFVKS